ncbi:ATP-binding cassette domain-containing protein [Agathobaculum sp.]|uniref:ATP-binding cassette domain-containing protein n=1 Tax=Agathobaculum sp. TaxID=2048138 RepID=UPI002A7FDFF0|nr:ATP-binding cassette domain-containing protein [Agathobaculum sp.]MDY3619045.1 ATP-binding cassette domain-containing protein [Agathobaculum sp.]
MNAIETQGLRYVYEDGTVALESLDFAAKRGCVTGVLGANGAGKSTLFLCLNGVLAPMGGTVRLSGQAVAFDRKGVKSLRKKVGIVFQDPDDQLFSSDVYRDISFGAVNLGLPEDEVRRRVEDAMEQVGISHLRDKPVHALSYGQKKRAAIAGVLVMRPEILILDEPTAGLDPQAAANMVCLCRTLQHTYGMTILLATHDIDLVPLLCDDVYLLSEGSIAAHGAPDELLRDPALFRAHHLRLPRIAHLMEILREKDGFPVDPGAATIGKARREIKRLMEDG